MNSQFPTQQQGQMPQMQMMMSQQQQQLPPGAQIVTRAVMQESHSSTNQATIINNGGQQQMVAQQSHQSYAHSQQMQQQGMQQMYQQTQSSQSYSMAMSNGQPMQQQMLPGSYSQQSPAYHPKLIEVEEITTPPVTSQEVALSTPMSSSRQSSNTNLLSHLDGSLLMQEILLRTTQQQGDGTVSLEGVPTVIDMQAIWGKSGGTILLSVRMQNQELYNVDVEELLVSFNPNACALTVAPYDYAACSSVKLGATSGMALVLEFDANNQRVTDDLLAIDIAIEYLIVSRADGRTKRLHFVHHSQVPMHILFIDHPQRQLRNDGRNNATVEDLSTLSVTDDGPRMTQSAFLQEWKQMQQVMPTFEITGVNVTRWQQQFGLQPQQAIEHKLAVNRIYNVASRQVGDLVMYVSFCVQSAGGRISVLVMAEMRFTSESVTVSCRASINEKLYAGLERAVRGILLS